LLLLLAGLSAPASVGQGPAQEPPQAKPDDKKDTPEKKDGDAKKSTDEKKGGEDKKNGEEKKNGDENKDKEKGKDEEKEPQWWSVHGQSTTVMQGNWKFRSPYVGPNSLLPILNQRSTETATLYLAGRIFEGGELIFNPEISGGRGLSRTLGLAGFPNGEATRVGAVAPTPYIARL